MKLNSMRKLLAWGAITALSVSCTPGLDGGSITGVFSGITSATVLGPQTVQVNWATNVNCSTYQIYQLSTSTSASIATVSVPPATIKYPLVQSDHSYTFAVGCVSSLNGDLSGLGVNQTASTWAMFNGVVTSSLDQSGTNPLVELSWNYATTTATEFQIYAQESSVPGDLSIWGLSQPGGAGTEYSDTPICTTYKNSIEIGPGQTCTGASLASGNTYNFKVVAKYPDGTYSTDIIGNGTSIAIPSSFTPPNCVLTKDGIGSDATSSYLLLRCTAGGSSSCSVANMAITAYQAVNGTRTLVSDTLVGAGTLRIAPQISTTSANDRVVNNLEIQYTCRSVTPNTVSIVRYDGTNVAYPIPSLKYGSANYETAPPAASALHPSYLGGSFAIGDFNCDGKPDLAVGLPKVSYNQEPYLNQAAESGAVKIYYDYAVTATGAITSASTEYLTFRDMPAYAHFGQSLSSGNINKDVHINDNGEIYSCDDLIIGAPGTPGTSNTYRGQAFIFYGQPQEFPQPLNQSGLAINAPTCSGDISSEVCSPVRLIPNSGAMQQYYHIDGSQTDQNAPINSGMGSADQVGFSVAYIRDFNADGYGDIAIGNPYCRWDGQGMNNAANPLGLSPPPNTPPLDVGCVYVYWGGPQGLQNTTVGNFPTGSTLSPIVAPFVKVYPPFPESGMHFGWSISGGGDVDGRLPVPILQNGGPGIILANGNDFVVGAPDFTYTGYDQGNGGYTSLAEEGKAETPNWTVAEGTLHSNCSTGTCGVDPIVMQGTASAATVETAYGPKITPPWNGAWAQATKTAWTGSGFPAPANQNLYNSTGIAFLYLGRSAHQSYDLTVTSAAATNMYAMPNQAPSIPTDGTQMNTLFSDSIRDRQNGSQYITTKNPITAFTAPTESFYNCGPRGGWLEPTTSGTYSHISCLAGRNNFSVIYPALPTTPAGLQVSQFGKNVKIAGSKEQNAVALYQLAVNIPATAYASVLDGSFLDLLPLQSGKAHERVRGTSMWELGIQGLNTGATAGYRDTTCEVSTDMTAPKLPGSCTSANYTGHLARSMLDESYNFPSSTWGLTPSATPTSDINKDGYADVVVTANNQVFTYFGNYAADFSYQKDTFAGSASCNVARLKTLPNSLFASNVQKPYGTGTPAPFTTFGTAQSAIVDASATPSYIISGEYPQFILPNTGNNVRAAYLDDIVTQTSTSPNFSYPDTITRTSVDSTGHLLGASCLPQVKTYATAPTSLSAADLNSDGIIDIVTGFAGANGGNGLTVASVSSTTGTGLASDINLTVPDVGALSGTAVAATNWKFIDDTSRRDLFSGGIGYSSGAGTVYAYSGAGNATISTSPNIQLYESSNAPNLLGMEYAKIIGDVNGDGYDDIWVPIKQFDASGNPYFDGMIYFGSAFGPITYTNCVAREASITFLSGGAGISTSDCAGTTTPQIALLEGTQINLPQYIHKPTGVSSDWALYPQAAGDVNRDGFQDLVFFDISGTNYRTPSSAAQIYLFFGSSSGIVNGQPLRGTSLNQAPQLVTSNYELAGGQGLDSGVTIGAGIASWFWPLFSPAAVVSSTGIATLPQTGHPIAHGDFNGDGYEDLAFGVYSGNGPSHDTPWICPAGAYLSSPCNTSPAPSAPYPSGGGGSAQPGLQGYVIVFYGGPGGYQTPVDSGTGLPSDFSYLDETCSDGLGSCDPMPNIGISKAARDATIRSPYGTLINTFTTDGKYNLDTTKTACNPASSTNTTPNYTCTGTFIRNPLFYNDAITGVGFYSMQTLLFGQSLTVADVNHDGIDDLVIGEPAGSHADWINTMFPQGYTIFGGNSDYGQKGMVFIYYGAKGAGIIAPTAGEVLGDRGMGIRADLSANPSQPVFQIYPMFANQNLPATFPELDGLFLSATNTTVDLDRHFGMTMTSGDFNGDGIDDVAIASANGQIYIYYGPLCQFDNTKTAIQTVMYANHNQACLTNNGGVSDICGTAPGTITAGSCTVLNFNATFAAATATNSVSFTDAPTKELYPQMIYVPGSTINTVMGSTLLSKRPVRSPATTTVLKNPGNINGDPEGTSDLLIGTGYQSDPNVVAPNPTGLGYLYFGHKTPSAGQMSSLPGIYAGGAATYNANLTAETLSNNTTYYFYTPVLLKPHTSDGLTGGFFQFETSIGDMNGDGTGDFVMPTQRLNTGADGNSTIILGGGFKLLY